MLNSNIPFIPCIISRVYYVYEAFERGNPFRVSTLMRASRTPIFNRAGRKIGPPSLGDDLCLSGRLNELITAWSNFSRLEF